MTAQCAKTIEHIKGNIESVIKVQASNGNYDCNEYMWGLANGLILALSIVTGQMPEYLDKPERWLDDLPKPELVEVVSE